MENPLRRKSHAKCGRCLIDTHTRSFETLPSSLYPLTALTDLNNIISGQSDGFEERPILTAYQHRIDCTGFNRQYLYALA